MISVVLSLLFASACANDIKNYYATASAPRPNLSVETVINAGVYNELKIPAILAIVKYELAKGELAERFARGSQASDRDR